MTDRQARRGATLLGSMVLALVVFTVGAGIVLYLAPARTLLSAVARRGDQFVDLHRRLEAALTDSRLPSAAGRPVGERLVFDGPSGIRLELEATVDPVVGDTCWRLASWSSR